MNLAFRQRFVYLVQDIYPDLAVKMGFLGTPLRRIAAACWQWLEKRVLCRASAIIVQGRDMGDVIRDKMPARLVHRIHIVPLCADHQRIHPLDGEGGDFRERWSSDDELIALYAGNIGVCHDLETILEAATLLQGEPVRIVFYGDGVKRKWLEATVKTRHLANVVIHDYVPCENLNKLLAACDVGLVAVDRRAEGLLLPWKTFNLMAAGKPVVAVASEKGDTGSLIADAKCGVLIEQGHPRELANCLSGLVRDRGSLAAMGAAGRRYLVANLSRQHRARQFTEIFRAVRVLKGSRIS
jgi:glycosyltransferase involved in cell wall biosynthesis